MKYQLIFAALLLTVFSCKSKKSIVQSNNTVADTMYVENSETGEISMIITTKSESPDGSWKLQSIGPDSDDEMSRISMKISTNEKNETVSGNDACNQYNGSITVFDAQKIEFSPLASTKRACMIPAKYAKQFYNAMQNVKTFYATGNQLKLIDGNGKKLLQFIKTE